MKSLEELCIVRKSVFNENKRDDVLDLTNLLENTINAEEFFAETFITDGMKRLFDSAFKRFSGKGSQGIIKLTQSMGGGKTHNMIALGMLAKNKNSRNKILNIENELNDIRVIGFTGRETDVKYGIWGELARQLGKLEEFNEYYSPLKVPGQSAWAKLLKGDPLLILLDELPPYLQAAKAQPIGNSDLAEVTTAALANLFNAINKAELSNVCLVISDLNATYEEGSELIQRSFKNIEGELDRFALMLQPVSSTSDEIYSILKTRLFEKLPNDDEINEVALAYKEKLSEAKKMNLTNGSPDSLFTGIKHSYPFHPSLRDLYARFKENQGFQQTRGLIRLMRTVVSDIFNSGEAENKYLISPFDIDLNKSDIFTQVVNIKPSLSNAISHDIASQGNSVAENIDKNYKTEIAQEFSKLVLMSSLADIPNALLGLTQSEIVENLCEPNKDLTVLRNVMQEYTLRAWYFWEDNANRIYFKDVKNIMAEMNTLVDSYSDETVLQELKKYLHKIFEPKLKDCYQNLLILPAIDDISKVISQDKITLVVVEPNIDNELPKDIKELYENIEYKNRIMFLTGKNSTWEKLKDSIKSYKALNSLITKMKEDRTPENNSQFITARENLEKINLSILQLTRETFIFLHIPNIRNIYKSDLMMNFSGNDYNIENQIKEVLIRKRKYTIDISSDEFKKKCEDRLFGSQKEIRWSDLKSKAASNISWNWHLPNALDSLKEKMLAQGFWREEGGGYIKKGSFELEDTDVIISTKNKNEETGEIILKIQPKFGDKVYFEYGEATPTTASQEVEDYNNFKTKDEMIFTFICIDSNGERKTGEPKIWRNELLLKNRQYNSGKELMVELKAYPKAEKIWYSTDGQDPKEYGAVYNGDITISEDCNLILAIAEYKDILSKKIEIKINRDKIEKGFEIDKNKKLVLRDKIGTSETLETYKTLKSIDKFNGKLSDIMITIYNNDNEDEWTEIVFSDEKLLDYNKLDKMINILRNEYDFGNSNVKIEFKKIHFDKGENFEMWIKDNKKPLNEFKPENIVQS